MIFVVDVPLRTKAASTPADGVCVPCGSPATHRYSLYAWNRSQMVTIGVWQTFAVPVPACAHCYRKKVIGQTFFGLALFFAVLGFPMAWNKHAYVGSIDSALLLGGSFGLVGVFLSILGSGVFNRWFMPIALDRYDMPSPLSAPPETWRVAIWARTPQVAERMRRSLARLA